MVCVANEVKVEYMIDDGTVKTESHCAMLPATTTIDELYKQVSTFHEREPESFELLYQPPQAKQIELTKSMDMTLLQLEPNCLKQTTTIIIKWKNFSLPRKSRNKNKMFTTLPQAPRTDPVVDLISNQPEKNYVGLVNQAMTCYLNSLLQALYMTPEFRNALYNWEYVGGSEKDEASSIPYQLQKLFLNLQTSTKLAVETTSLTKSFGWDSTEAWQQHDIQELCRVMFDALETMFKNTEQADLINRLYEGKMIDYVKCLECKTEKSREDTFLDIPLPVRPFESTVAYGSVEESLRAFVKYETLEGNNQYHCEKCNKKCDAHKGLKFTKFPYLLTLHLKRFDFDYNTLCRIKLNDKVTFPHILDLNSFIKTSNQESLNGEEDSGLSVRCDDSSTTDSGTLEDKCSPCDGAISTNNNSNNHDQDDDEGIDMSNGHSSMNGIGHNHENEKNRGKCLMDRGPYMYELYSIMIHSGSASGGHYYAYIKDFETKQWLCFNDMTVNLITDSDIEKVYGGGPTRAYSSSTNAYMLMYRQIDPSKNALPIQEENFSQHIRALLEKMKETEEDDRRYSVKHANTYKLKIRCYHPKTKKLMTNRLHTIGESTWGEQTEKAYEKFGLQNYVNLDQCRLVFYDPSNHLITNSYEGSDDELICDIFKGDHQSNLLLEIREKDQQFETYKPDGIATEVYVIDVAQADIIDGPFSVRGYESQTVREFKQQLAKIVRTDPADMKLVKKSLSQLQLLQDDDTLEGIPHTVHKLYVTLMGDADTTKPSKNTANESPNSELYAVIDNFKTVTWIAIQLPPPSKEIIEEIIIPSLENESKEESTKPSSNVTVLDAADISFDIVGAKFMLKGNQFTNSHQGLSSRRRRLLDYKPNEYSFGNNSDCFKWKAGLESTSEDSSLSDSEKTLIDESLDCRLKKIMDKFHTGHFNSDSGDESNYYFKAKLCTSTDNERWLRVLADERIRIETLKKKLEKFVGVPADDFNLYSHNADTLVEDTDLKTTLELFDIGEKFCIKRERALRKGELKVKLYQLYLNSPSNPFEFLFDWIVSKDMTVAQAKEEMIAEFKRKYNLEIPFNRLRLREKTYRFASTVLLNQYKFEDLNLSSGDELVVQKLSENETVTEPTQLVLFVRRWFRSNLQLGPFEEVVLDGRTFSELKEKINLLSGIPEDNIEIAKGKGSFPCESINFLNVETEFDWKEKKNNVDKWPLNLEDGFVLFYRDSKEKVKQLNSEEKREFTNKENTRLLCLGTTPSFSSPRREKGLKIYLDSK